MASHAASDDSLSARPNIVLIVLDDLDYTDVGVYGSPDILTETMDRFAAQGMRFERFYSNGPVCSPTRVSILTGQYPARYGVKRSIGERSRRGIPEEVTTLPEALKAAGYRTAHIGKWHVGTSRPEFLPTNMGFDTSVRLLGRGYHRYELSMDDADPVLVDDGEHLTETLTDHAVDFLSQTVQDHPDEPFFLNLWYFAPHIPLEPPNAFDNTETKYCLDADAGDGCNVQRGRFSALVTNVDRQIQRVLQVLDEQERVRRNTLVIITSDNGGEYRTHNARILPQRRLRGYKANLFEGGIQVPMMARWPGVIPEGTVSPSVLATFDFFPTFAEAAGLDVESFDLDGTSFLDVLRTNRQSARHEPLFWEDKRSNRAFSNTSGIYNTYVVRDKEWKLTFQPAMEPGLVERLKLYNLVADPSEQHDLNELAAVPERGVRLFGYRLGISKKRELAQEHPAYVYQVLVNHLQQQYVDWRRDVGTVDYRYELGRSGVRAEGDRFVFDGGVVRVADDVRLDFSDYDFSFLTHVTPEAVSNRAVIATRPGSWELALDEGRLNLKVGGDTSSDAAAEVLLEGGAVQAGQAYHVAFTVFGWRDSESTIRLYLNGQLVAEAAGAASVRSVTSEDSADEWMIYLGNDPSGAAPFRGAMVRPQMSVLAWYPAEVMWSAAEGGEADVLLARQNVAEGDDAPGVPLPWRLVILIVVVLILIGAFVSFYYFRRGKWMSSSPSSA